MSELNSNYLSINRVAMELDVSPQTIRRWYKWWESPEMEKPSGLYLPPYYYKDHRGTKFFLKSDIFYLKEFRNKLQTTYKGCMAEFNAVYQWGKRGKRALENKGTTVQEIQKKVR